VLESPRTEILDGAAQLGLVVAPAAAAGRHRGLVRFSSTDTVRGPSRPCRPSRVARTRGSRPPYPNSATAPWAGFLRSAAGEFDTIVVLALGAAPWTAISAGLAVARPVQRGLLGGPGRLRNGAEFARLVDAEWCADQAVVLRIAGIADMPVSSWADLTQSGHA